jgi:tmRNA-binding protein
MIKYKNKLYLNFLIIKKLIGKITQKGYTIVPTSIYFNENNIVKLEIALASGKKLHDKRQTIKERDWEREKKSLLKHEMLSKRYIIDDYRKEYCYRVELIPFLLT